METSEPAAMTCARHPRVATGLRCSQCETPICPRCAATTPVGQKCPDCVRQPRAARRLGRPRQLAKGVAAGVGAATAAAFVLQLVYGTGMLSWIASGVAGYGIGRAVRAGAEGNAAPRLRTASMVLAGAAAVGGYLLLAGDLSGLLGPYRLVSVAVGVYGAYVAYR